MTPIACRGLGFAEAFQLRDDLDSSRFDFAIMRQRLGRWIDNDRSVGPVEQHMLTGLEFFCDIVQTDHRGNVERTRHDRCMRGATTEIGREPEDALLVHSRRVRWGEIMRDENVRLAQPKKCFRRFPL